LRVKYEPPLMRRAPEQVEGAGPKRSGGMAVRESDSKIPVGNAGGRWPD